MPSASSAISRRVVVGAAVACLAGYVFVYASGRATTPIRSDGFSYYVYLPSWFIFHDPTLAATARDCCGGEYPAYTAIIRWPGTRRWVDAHPIGVAIMQAPLFFVAHALTKWTNLPADGFSLYYQHAVGLSGLIAIVAGLWVLRNLLRRHFSEGVTAATLVSVLLGTNLFHYATFDSSYSHPYSFFLIAAFLDLTDRWFRETATSPVDSHAHGSNFQSWRAVLAGLVAGLIILTRHTNALALMFLPLYGVTSLVSLRLRMRMLAGRRRELGLLVAVAGLVLAPQLAIYHQATGHVLVSSYGTLGFNFASPRIVEVLFSVQKGVFFWSPVLVLGCVGLLRLVLSRESARAFVTPAAVFLVADTYVIASWWDWQFGGSFGHRGFVDALPVFAIGLASFFTWTAHDTARRVAVGAGVALAVGLSLVLMLQYWNGVLPYSDATWTQYRAALGFK